MLIANPIYDTVFKYLMENIDIAKEVIMAIIQEEIAALSFSAQENVKTERFPFSVYHLDFIAQIRTGQGQYKNVLIEMQKTNLAFDILRFRNYLGDRYKRVDEIVKPDGSVEQEALPIITIYFLGFKLSRPLAPVIKVNRHCLDLLNDCTPIEGTNDFIEKLTHDAYIIQIPLLKVKLRNKLEEILSIFEQDHFIDKTHRLKDYDHETSSEIMQKILRQLSKAAADENLLKELELEEQAEREAEVALGKLIKELEKKDKKLEEKDKKLEEKDKKLEEKDKMLEEKDKYIQELLKKLNQS